MKSFRFKMVVFRVLQTIVVGVFTISQSECSISGRIFHTPIHIYPSLSVHHRCSLFTHPLFWTKKWTKVSIILYKTSNSVASFHASWNYPPSNSREITFFSRFMGGNFSSWKEREKAPIFTNSRE